MTRIVTELPRDGRGRIVSRRCPDPNCGGVLQHEREGWWRCDGLTHVSDTGPLFACKEGKMPPYYQNLVQP